MDPKKIKMNRLYGELAGLLPLLGPPEEYAEEAGHWRRVLREKLGAGRHRVLELGVGGGYNLSHLTSDFEATGVDLSEAMLARCRILNPGVELHLGDMRTVRLGRRFRAVLIHDAVSYMRSEADLRATFQTAAVHLEPGGVLVISPDDIGDTFPGPQVESATHSAGDIQLTHVQYTHDPDPGDTTIEHILVYFIREGGRLRLEHDRHVTGLFPLATWARLMNEAGFAFEERTFPLQGGRQEYRLLVGVLPPGG
jgi:SAM-dependent methyltransferase